MPTAAPPTTLPDDVSAGLANAIVATGFRWTIFDFKIADIVDHIQHRSDDSLNKGAMRRYANQMRVGSVPPHIGVTRDGWGIWGHHRAGAADLAGWETLPAIVFDVDGADAQNDEFLNNSLISLAVAENAPYGLPYNPTDRQEAAQALLNLGFTHQSIVKELGLSASQVSNIASEMQGQKRLDNLGVTADLQRTVVQALAAPDARALNDEPFKRLADLAIAAKLTPKEIRQFAKEARTPGSEAGAVSTIADITSDMAQRIFEVAAGGSVRPTPVGKLIGVLKQVTDLCDSVTTPKVYRDRTGDADETIALLDAALGCLKGIRAVQEDQAA